MAGELDDRPDAPRTWTTDPSIATRMRVFRPREAHGTCDRREHWGFGVRIPQCSYARRAPRKKRKKQSGPAGGVGLGEGARAVQDDAEGDAGRVAHDPPAVVPLDAG